MAASISALVQAFRHAAVNEVLAPLVPRVAQAELRIERLERAVSVLAFQAGADAMTRQALKELMGDSGVESPPAQRDLAGLVSKVSVLVHEIMGPQATVVVREHFADGRLERVLEAHYGLLEHDVPADLAERHERVLNAYLSLPKADREGVTFARFVR
jgi:hypothetical protein